MNSTIRFGLVPVGGYGQAHLQTIRTLHTTGEAKLVAAVARRPEKVAEAAAAVQAHGAKLYGSYEEMLAAADMDAVVISTPIHLHCEQAIAALEAGKDVLLEKPPCATLEEWEQMEAAEKASGKRLIIGFQMQSSPNLHWLKEQLLAGAIGRLERVWASIRSCRYDGYYDRAPWSAKWEMDGKPVYDGPATNALAHVVHSALFLAGDSQNEWPQLQAVRGALWKARQLDCYDTSYMEGETSTGKVVQIATTHASSLSDPVFIHCQGTAGRATVGFDGSVSLEPAGQPAQKLMLHHYPHIAALMDFLRAVREPQWEPYTPLRKTRAYMDLVVGTRRSSAGSRSFDSNLVHEGISATNERYFEVAGLDEQYAAFKDDPRQIPAVLQVESMQRIPIES